MSRATPIARKRPDLMCGITSEGWPPPIVRWPPARAVTASAPPVKGTTVIGKLARFAMAFRVMSTTPVATEAAAVTLFPLLA